MQNFRSGSRGAAAGGPKTSATFGDSAIRSVELQPRTYSAEYGSAGGVIAVTSRGLAERLHGTVSANARQSALAATNPYSVVTHYNNGSVTSQMEKPQDSILRFGASVGLPLSRAPLPWMRRSALFGSVEGQMRTGQVISSPATANFYALTPEQMGLLANRGVPSAAVSSALEFLDSLSGPVQRDSTRWLSFARLDVKATPRQQLTFGYIGNRFHTPTGFSSGVSDAVAPRGRGSFASSSLDVDAFTGRWMVRISPRATQELRGQFAHDLEFESPEAPLPQEPAIGVGGYVPQVSIAPNGFSYGTPASVGRTAYPDEKRLQLADTMAAVEGHHLFSAGVDWSRITDRIAGAINAEGTFLYDSGTTNGRDGGLVDWITDYTFNVHAYPNGACPSINAAVHLFCFRSYTQEFSAQASEFVTHNIAGFAQDAVELSHGLRISVGMRYDYTLLPPPQQPNPALDLVLASIASPIAGASSVIPEDRNNFGPRLSVAWSPRRELVTARLSYGVFYGRVAGATVNAALTDTALPSSTQRIRITPSTTTECPQVQNQGFGYPCAYVTEPPSAVAQTTSALVFSKRFRLPAVQRGTFSIEHTTRRIDLRAGYTLSIATQLPQSVDLNIAPATGDVTYILQGGDGQHGLYSGETFSIPLYTERRSTVFGPITALISNANATYHALNAEARVHTHGMELRGTYTFSKAIDYGPQLSATPRENGQFDPFADGYDKALSGLDVRHRFTADVSLRSSVRRGSPFVRGTFSGWQLMTLASVSSGAPYGYAIFGGTRLKGGGESINGSGGATYLPTVGRNTLRLPVRSRSDLRFGRELTVHDHYRLQAFAEAFNAFNSQSLSRVETRAFLVGTPAEPGEPIPLVFQDQATVEAEGVTTAPFGTPLSSTADASRERQVELGFRLEF
jgi:hypothetical protein